MVDQCSFCGSEDVRLFDAITDKGIVKICSKCSFNENIPIIHKPTTFQLKEAEKKKSSFSERAEEERKEIIEEKIKRSNLQEQNLTLKDIINKNYKPSVSVNEKPRLNLVDNFHWIVMRARKKMHLTQSQLADEIHESEAAIKMIESGVLPEDDYKLINKLENFLKIWIQENREGHSLAVEKEPIRVLNFKEDINNITIADLQKIKKEKDILANEELMEEVRRKLEGEEIDFR